MNRQYSTRARIMTVGGTGMWPTQREALGTADWKREGRINSPSGKEKKVSLYVAYYSEDASRE